MRKLSEGMTACPYDLDNLRGSGKALLSSIDLELWTRIEKNLFLGEDATGPEVLSMIVMHFSRNECPMISPYRMNSLCRSVLAQNSKKSGLIEAYRSRFCTSKVSIEVFKSWYWLSAASEYGYI